MESSITKPLLQGDQGKEEYVGTVPERKNERVLSGKGIRGISSYARTRTLLRAKRDSEVTARGENLSAFQSTFRRIREELTSVSLPLKAGLAAAFASLLCFAPGVLKPLNKNGVWAVVTADIVLEANVGLTFSKGVNRTIGTLVASLMALGVNFAARFFGDLEPYFLVACVFVGAAVPTIFKFRRPFKDRWNYAVVMSMITFHILVLSKSEYHEKIKLPLIRLVTIAIGFLVASFINLAIAPKFTASSINELLAKNFERAGNVMECCVDEYCDGKVLGSMSEIKGASHALADDIHLCFHEIVAADSEVDKLLRAVKWEPCHGKFFYGYPWDLYEDITENLRYVLYDVVALDSCLRGEIQAPLYLRKIFEEEFRCIGRECSGVMRSLGETVLTMSHVNRQHLMAQAEEGAILLQHKIAKRISNLLSGSTGMVHTAESGLRRPGDVDLDKAEYLQVITDMTSPFTFVEDDSKTDRPKSSLGMGSADHVNEDLIRKSQSRNHFSEEHEDFFRKQDSLGRHWDETVQRISALSLIKFASLLIELVAKTKYVVTLIDELELKAKFDGVESSMMNSQRGLHV